MEFEPPESHPLAWPLVPLGYVFDAPLAAALLAVELPLVLLTDGLSNFVLYQQTGRWGTPDLCELPPE